MIDKAFNKKRLPFPILGGVDMDQLVQGSKPAVAPSTAAPSAPGLDPTAARILQHLMPDRSQSGQARDQAEADKIRADSFGGRAGGFAPTKESYHDDPSLPMAQRMEAFHNRTNREGQQTLGPDQAKARAAVGMETNNGTDFSRLLGVDTSHAGYQTPQLSGTNGQPVPTTGFSGKSQYGTASVSFPGQTPNPTLPQTNDYGVVDMSKLTHGQQAHVAQPVEGGQPTTPIQAPTTATPPQTDEGPALVGSFGQPNPMAAGNAFFHWLAHQLGRTTPQGGM